MYVICATPLVKIFLREWHDRLLEDPELIKDFETPFEFTAVTGTRGFKLKFNTPMQVNDNDLYKWLVGGNTGAESKDTDIYGIVPFDPKIDMATTLDELSVLEDFVSDDPKKAAAAAKKRDAMRKEAANKIKATRERVREASETRVRRAIRFNHNNLIKQWQTNEEMKMGKYPPSVAEMLGAHAIDKEISDAKNRGSELKKRMSDLMQNQVV